MNDYCCSGAERAGPHQLPPAIIRGAYAGQRPLSRIVAQRRAAQQKSYRRGKATRGIPNVRSEE